MLDIWGFLLQTLTATGAALMILAVKAMFRDKLPPKWQFAVWAVLGAVILVPAGMSGRYALLNWPVAVDTLKLLAGDSFQLTRVYFPVPWITEIPKTVWDWLFVAYTAGVIISIGKYLHAYIRLRRVIRHGDPADMEQIKAVAETYGLRVCAAVSLPGASSAFVCGVIHPVLVLPEDGVEDKVILHELLHLRSRDTVWSVLICILRCIHWCNPVLGWCADIAGNDLESRCDQQVLELLEGEERRDYGRILLSMTNDRYAHIPGATCVNNGGSNIRRRIEAIARFRRYPKGMGLVSVCAGILLGSALVIGVKATEVVSDDYFLPSLASCRTMACTTPAGAMDAYGKSVLDMNGAYRLLCAPEEMQEDICTALMQRKEEGWYPYWDTGLPAWPNQRAGCFFYNLKAVGDTYECLMVVQLNYPPDGKPEEDGTVWLATQPIRLEKEENRWIVRELGEFRCVQTQSQSLDRGCEELPALVYSGTSGDLRLEIRTQTIHTVSNKNESLVPKPSADFAYSYSHDSVICTHFGTQEQRDKIRQIGVSVSPWVAGETRPDLESAGGAGMTGSSTNGNTWGGRSVEPGWGPSVTVSGGGTGGSGNVLHLQQPECYAADLYINGKKAEQLELRPEKGDT